MPTQLFSHLSKVLASADAYLVIVFRLKTVKSTVTPCYATKLKCSPLDGGACHKKGITIWHFNLNMLELEILFYSHQRSLNFENSSFQNNITLFMILAWDLWLVGVKQRALVCFLFHGLVHFCTCLLIVLLWRHF